MLQSLNTQAQRMTLVERIAGVIRQRIAVGEYPPQSYLPSERRLAQQFDASRGTVSSALRILAESGLLEQYPGRGTQVASVPSAVSQKSLLVVANDYNLLSGEARRLSRGITAALAQSGAEYHRIDHDQVTDNPQRVFVPDQAVVFLEVSPQHRQIATSLHGRGVPLVVSNIEPPDLPLPGTRVDHAAVTRRAVELLTDLGHRRIGFVGNLSTAHFYGVMQRQFIESMKQRGLAVDPAWVAVSAGSKALAGYRGTRQMVQRDHPVTAIIAGRDSYAEGACQAIWDLGLQVGRDVSIVGYDDVSWSMEGDEPSFLTTFAEPCEQLGTEAVRMLMRRLVVGEYEPLQRVLEAPLVLRQSAGPVAPPKPKPTCIGHEIEASSTPFTPLSGASSCHATPLTTASR